MIAPDPLTPFTSPAAERNKAAIGDALEGWLPRRGALLELACGALQHARFLAPRWPALSWQPSDHNTRVVEAGKACAAVAPDWPPNLQAPIALDVGQRPWAVGRFDAIYTANLLHIAPLTVSDAVLAEVPAHLTRTGILLIYGPFRRDGVFTSQGDARFDADLRARDASWGIRDLTYLTERGAAAGLELRDAHAMPANNWLLRFVLRG